ncbi:MAG: rhodanese-like domain-containing protein, partial [Planctomycetota bacterium]|nr:rhodanese-like domain-containing protein [Planctomycetota bacterium]
MGAFEIVSASRAQRLVSTGKVHVLDARPVGKYLAGHLPGAVQVDDECLRRSVSGMPATYLPECELAGVFERAGVSEARPVLVYSDGEDPLAATMTAYALLKAGHPRVMVLDGGFESWRGNGEVTQAYAAFDVVPWTAAAPTSPIAASLADVRRVVDTDEGTLLDARPAKVYRGEGKAWPRNGHIPRAINVDWKSLMRADNEALYKPRKEIEKLLKDAGLDAQNPTVVYCGTGREATLLYLYLRGVLNWPRVTMYEGSWTEWSGDPALPIATGDEPYVPVHRDGELLMSAQPSEALLRELADDGVTTIINCRTAGEMSNVGFSEGALAKSLGIKYVEIPLGGNEGYEPSDVAALRDALAARPAGKVLMHCASGGRSVQLWIAHLTMNEGLTLEQAQDRARAAGMLRPSSIERLLGKSTR